MLIDYYILDLKEKKIYLSEWVKNDSFVEGLDNIENINIIKNKDHTKTINIKLKGKDNIITIELDKYNRIIKYINDNIIIIKNNFMYRNKTIKELKLKNTIFIGNYFLNNNNSLEELTLENVEIIKDAFMEHNKSLKELNAPNLKESGYLFLEDNEYINKNLRVRKWKKKNY